MYELENATTFDLLRHGEPEGGVLVRGYRDDPLTETGWEQMYKTVGDHAPWDLIVSSPLSRCQKFAEKLSKKLALPMQIETELKEIGFGEWEGRLPAEPYAEQPEAVANFWKDPGLYPPPKGEPLGSFQLRVKGAWDRLKNQHEGSHILVVAHGGVNRLIIGDVLGLPLGNLFRMEIPFAGISRVRIQEGTSRLVFHCGSL